MLVLDMHERRNALDITACDALREAFETALAKGARAIVVTGQGSCFCAGADLSGVYDQGFRTALYGMLRTITAASVPVIAAVNGPAIGAGTQLAIACDLRVAAQTARFAVPTARKGLAVDPWTVRRLALLAGGGSARALLIGGETIGAEVAFARGLVDRLGDLPDALAWAREVAAFASQSLAYSKKALESMFEPRLWDAELDAAFERCWPDTGATS
ncbi:enoyl-CoA hydratase [Actinomadura sp. LD22]|uniref:Enoyl-CoA hydratase n=2 Tax=Actinomadura physcomitrii TaxID=2650748 RepID=A0A6I4MGA7_9ACTN|nr:enoyl-CoA hydratase [Actinomadura physcomitrii]